MTRIKGILSVCARIIVSFLLLYLLFKINKIDLAGLAGDIKSTDKPLLFAGLALAIVPYALSLLRWKMLLDAAGICAPFRDVISSFSGGIFFSIFLPSTIGGDLLRAGYMTHHTSKAKAVVATVLLDRISGYVGMVLVVLLALALGFQHAADKTVYVSVAVLIILLAAILLVMFNTAIYRLINRLLGTPGTGKIRDAVRSLHREIHIFRQHGRMIALNLVISFFIQLLGPVCTYFIALSLGIKIPFIYFIVFLPIIAAVTLLPVAISGLGLRENLFVFYFAKAAVAQNLAIAMSLLSFAFAVFYGALGGLIYVFTVHRKAGVAPDKFAGA